MKIALNILKFWLPLATAVTLLSGLVYVTVQQSLRQGANDPQIQMAEDAARVIAGGQPAESVLPAGKIDLSQSQSAYLIIFDREGNPTASNATLHGNLPNVPKGVFEYTLQKGEDRITWEPEPGVRQAAVIVPVSGEQGNFVLAGRSLREVEQRESQLTSLVSAGWLVTMLATLLLVAVFEILPATRSQL